MTANEAVAVRILFTAKAGRAQVWWMGVLIAGVR